MPPRKSNVSTTSNGAEDGAESTPVRSTKDGTSIEDLTLPKSMIARLAKGVLPANTQIHKDALLALHKSATVFVSYIASNSSENAQLSNKKTIMPPDVVAALKDAEFESFLPRLEAELKKYNDVQCDKRNTYRRKIKEEKAAAAARGEGQEGEDGETGALDGIANGHGEDGDVDRPVKKLKGDAGQAVAADADGMEDGDEDEEPEAEEHEDDEVEGESADDDGEDEKDDEPLDDTMEDTVEEHEESDELRDEALDEPESD